MNNQSDSNNSAIIERGSTLDYVRMVNEVSMEEAIFILQRQGYLVTAPSTT